MKPDIMSQSQYAILVAPYVGAWIETAVISLVPSHADVAPYVGAWIETPMPTVQTWQKPSSLPTWERGLKPCRITYSGRPISVAPYVGAWIET